LVRARERLEVLDEMAETASEYADLDRAFDYGELESRLREDVSYFLEEMARISAQVDYDWHESIERLEAFTDELEQQRRIFAELDDLPDSRAALETRLEAEPEPEPEPESAER
jgi:hypothetical protein